MTAYHRSAAARTASYTPCVGKWHLGLDWATHKPQHFGDAVAPKGDIRQVDYAAPIAHGPRTVGFDEFFGISASLDMPPFLFIRDDHCVGQPTTAKTYIRKGPAVADFEAVDVLPSLVRQSCAFLDRQKGSPSPFFLYLALSAPHTPIAPDKDHAGRSGLGPYGDFVTQVDAAVGTLLDALHRNGQERDTLVIFTSDNGCSPMADFKALAMHGHDPNRPWRGAKADVFEGGHRIPFIARWPGKVPAASRCDDTVCLTDLLATCAGIVGAALPANAGEDSVDILPDLLATAKGPLREATVHHSINGSFAIRQGVWKLALCPDSGGWSPPKPGSPESRSLPRVQLYDLSTDPGERHNVQDRHPEIVHRLERLLERYRHDGHSVSRAKPA